MASQTDFPDVLERLDLGPLRVEVERLPDLPDRADAVLRLQWMGPSDQWDHPGRRRGGSVHHWDDQPRWYAAEFRKGRALREVRNAAWQVLDHTYSPSPDPEERRLLVMPYLNKASLGVLQEMGVSGLDLCGNGIVQGDGWWFYQHGNPNRYSKQRSRAPYRGKSALVGRALMLRPWYETVGEIQEEIEERGASISLSQVSKVLSALEDDLVIRKKGHGVRLLQPKKLLDSLVDAYKVPEPSATLETSVPLQPDLFAHLSERAREAGARIVGFDPQRYVIAPEARERMEVYVEPSIGPDLPDALGLDRVSRFSNLVVRVVDEPGVYFDSVEDDDFHWAPPLEVYLQLMQGGKREKEIAADLRGDLLANAEAA